MAVVRTSMLARATLAVALLTACSSGTENPSSGAGGSASGGSGNGGSGGSGGGGANAGGSSGSGGANSGGSGGTNNGGSGGIAGTGGSILHFDGGVVSPNLGDVEVVDIPEGSACVAAGGTPVTLSTSTSLGTTFLRTGAVGTRRYAFGSDSNVLMTFEPDGSLPSALVVGPSAVAATDTIAAASLSLSSVTVSFYDSLAAATGSTVTIPLTAPDAPSIAIGAQGTLVTFRAQGIIHGRLIRNGATAGSFDLSATSGGSGACQTATVADDQGFGVVYNRHQLDGTTQTSWLRVGTDGTVTLAKTVLTSQGAHQLVDLVRWSTGYLALFGEGSISGTAVLVSLDEFGNLIPPARRVLGVDLPLGLAVNGTNIMVTAVLPDGRAAVRPIDVAGQPLGSFVCVDDSSPDGGSFYAQAGVAAQGTGWGIVSRMTNLSAAYRVTDLAGTGP